MFVHLRLLTVKQAALQNTFGMLMWLRKYQILAELFYIAVDSLASLNNIVYVHYSWKT